MGRPIVSPAANRAQQQSRGQLQKQIDAQRDAAIERRTNANVALRVAFEPLSERDRQIIRREVALSVPNEPMLAEDLQLWLDERCIGVARYMTSGKIT